MSAELPEFRVGCTRKKPLPAVKVQHCSCLMNVELLGLKMIEDLEGQMEDHEAQELLDGLHAELGEGIAGGLGEPERGDGQRPQGEGLVAAGDELAGRSAEPRDGRRRADGVGYGQA